MSLVLLRKTRDTASKGCIKVYTQSSPSREERERMCQKVFMEKRRSYRMKRGREMRRGKGSRRACPKLAGAGRVLHTCRVEMRSAPVKGRRLNVPNVISPGQRDRRSLLAVGEGGDPISSLCSVSVGSKTECIKRGRNGELRNTSISGKRGKSTHSEAGPFHSPGQAVCAFSPFPAIFTLKRECTLQCTPRKSSHFECIFSYV